MSFIKAYLLVGNIVGLLVLVAYICSKKRMQAKQSQEAVERNLAAREAAVSKAEAAISEKKAQRPLYQVMQTGIIRPVCKEDGPVMFQTYTFGGSGAGVPAPPPLEDLTSADKALADLGYAKQKGCLRYTKAPDENNRLYCILEFHDGGTYTLETNLETAVPVDAALSDAIKAKLCELNGE